MPLEPPPWIEIELAPDGQGVWVTARDSRGERSDGHALGPGFGLEQLAAFTRTVASAVAREAALDAATVQRAQELHAALFQGRVRDLFMQLSGSARGKEL